MASPVHPLIQTARGELVDEDYGAVETTLAVALEAAKDLEAEADRLCAENEDLQERIAIATGNPCAGCQAEYERLSTVLKGIWDYGYGAAGETDDPGGHLTEVGMRAKEALENAPAASDEKSNNGDPT